MSKLIAVLAGLAGAILLETGIADASPDQPDSERLKRETRIQLAAGPPDLSGLQAEERTSIEKVCGFYQRTEGAESYHRCLRDKLIELERSPGSPDLSGLPANERASHEKVCAFYQRTEGPAGYYRCLRTVLAELDRSPGFPDLSGLPANERASIESICGFRQRTQGAAAYYPCLRTKLGELKRSSVGSKSAGAEKDPPEKFGTGPEQTDRGPAIPESGGRPVAGVYKVQVYLKYLGYDPGPADGRLGARTTRAIKAFQRTQGLQPRGRIDRPFLEALVIAVRDTKLRRDALRARTAPRRQSAWPDWTGAKSVLPASQTGKPLSPAQVYDAVKGNVWMIMAGRNQTNFRQQRNLSQGSAVAVSPNELLTNCHVVKNRPLIAIVQAKVVKEAKLTAADPPSDRCIIEVEGADLEPVRGIRRFEDLKVGERVYTVGAPVSLELTLGEGIISGLRTMENGRFVQTSAPISPGSSGGGLFDSFGNLVGVTTFELKDAQARSQALNFAIAAEDFWH
jgi:peptidoglycan hydrolase-like protein with peptidoglycan-binding domain